MLYITINISLYLFFSLLLACEFNGERRGKKEMTLEE